MMNQKKQPLSVLLTNAETKHGAVAYAHQKVTQPVFPISTKPCLAADALANPSIVLLYR